MAQDENLMRDFSGNPNPNPSSKFEVGAGRSAPVAGVAPASGFDAAPVESAPLSAPAEEQTRVEGEYSVTPRVNGEQHIYLRTPDGDDQDLGLVAVPNAEEILNKISPPNEISGAWYGVPQEVALSLKEGKLPLPAFLKGMYENGEVGHRRGMLGTEALKGKISFSNAAVHGDEELLKTIVNERPALWGEGFAGLMGNMRWGAGVAVQILPGVARGAGAGAKDSAAILAGLGAATLATGGLDTPATIPLAASAISLGMTNGIVKYTMETEGGNLALDMYKKGFKEETIRKVAPAAGALMGFLEVAQFKFLAAPFKKAFLKKVVDSGPVKTALVDWVKNTMGETSTEVAQEVVTQATTQLSAMYEKRPELQNNWKATKKAFLDTLVESMVGMAIIGAPGAAVQAYGTREQKAGIRLVKAKIEDTGEIPSAAVIERTIIGDAKPIFLEAKKLNEGLRNTDADLNAIGQKIAGNDDAKAALHAAVESRKIELKALTPEMKISPESEARVIKLAEELQSLSTIAAGVSEGEKISAAREVEPMVPLKEPKTPVEYVERRYSEQQAVISQLEKENSVLDKELADVNDEIVERLANGQTTAALAARASKLAAKISENDAKGADIVMTPMGAEEELADELERTGAMGLVRASDLVAMERSIVDKVAAVKISAFKHGEAYSRREVKKVQRYISELVKRSGMTDSQKKHFDGILRNTLTVEQLEKNYPEIRDRIFEAEDIARGKAADAFLRKELKSAKTKPTGKKAIGRLGDADTQSLVSVVTNALKLTRERSALEIADAEDALLKTEDESAPDYAPLEHAKARYQLQALQYRAGNLSMRDSVAFVKDVASMIEGAKSKFLAQKLAEKEAFAKEVDAGINDAMGQIIEPEGWDKGRVESYGWVKGAEKARSVLWAAGKKIIDNMWSLADAISQRSSKKTGGSWISRVFDPSEAAIRKDGLIQDWHDAYVDAAAKAYGFDGSIDAKRRQLNRLKSRLVERHDLGAHKNAAGQIVKLDFSVFEAIKRYMERQDPTLAQNLFEPTGLAYTPEMEREIFGVLTDGDKRFAMGQLGLYREMYKQVNAIYRKVRGVDLPFNAFYSPISVIGFRGKDGPALDPDSSAALSQHLSPKTTLGPWAINRTRHTLPLDQTSAEAVFNKHVYDMAHFIAFEGKVREWNKVLATPRFRAFVTGVYGSEALQALETMVSRVTSGTHEQMLMRGFNQVITRLAIAEIVGKAVAIPKQLSAMPAFLNAIPIQDLHLFLTEIGNVAIKGFSKEWVNSDFVRSRGMNQSQELRAWEDWAKSGSFLRNPSIIEMLAKFIQWGDKVSILVGGDALYRYGRSKGMTVDAAVAVASKTARDTQSTGSMDTLSVLQGSTGGGGFARLFTLYQNQPLQFVRLEMQAFRAMATRGFLKGEGRMTRTEVAKTLVLFHIFIPMLFQAIVDAGWDEEKQKRAAILGSFNSVPLLSQVVLKLYHQIMKDSDIPMGAGTIYDSWIRDLEKGTKELMNSASVADVAGALALLSDPVFKGVWGLPTEPFVRGAAALSSMAKGEGEFMDNVKLLAGYSPYMVKEQAKRTGGAGLGLVTEKALSDRKKRKGFGLVTE